MLPLRSSTIPIETGTSSSLRERISCRTPSSVSVNDSLDRPLTMAPWRSTTVTGTSTSVASARKGVISDAGTFCAAAIQGAVITRILAVKTPPDGNHLSDCMKSALLAAPLSGGRSHSRSGPGHSNLFCVARRPVFDIDPATHGEGLRVDDLKVPESQTAGGPIAETLLDPVFRNMEARGDPRRAPAANEE